MLLVYKPESWRDCNILNGGGCLFLAARFLGATPHQYIAWSKQMMWLALVAAIVLVNLITVIINSTYGADRGGTTKVVRLGKNNTTPRDNLYDGT